MTDMLTARVRRDFLKSCEAIRHGSLILTTPEGTRHDFGTGEPVAELILHDWAAITASQTPMRPMALMIGSMIQRSSTQYMNLARPRVNATIV